MKAYANGILTRLGKLVHFLLTVLLFACFCLSGFAGETREALAALLLYGAFFGLSVRIYEGYRLGLSQPRTLVLSQTLADAVSAAGFYVLSSLERFALQSPLPYFALLAVQLLHNAGWSCAAIRLFGRLNPPWRTAILCGGEEDLHRLDELRAHSRRFAVEKVIMSPSADMRALLGELEGMEAVFVADVPAALRAELVPYCVARGMRCYVLPTVGDVLMMGAQRVSLFATPVYCVMRAEPGIGARIAKRGLDIVCALIGLVLASPVMLVIGLAVKLCDGGPVLYRQTRLTRDGRPFCMLKFRSMRVDAERDGVARLAAREDDRVTPVGRVIRSCRLDELPQLLNVLRGDMSIVGPRPERPEIARQVERTVPAFPLRLQVRAGLTGLAQVDGRYDTPPADKLLMDLAYINRMSVLFDLRLMLSTIKTLCMTERACGLRRERVPVMEQAGIAVK